jgi:hypothetical protein
LAQDAHGYAHLVHLPLIAKYGREQVKLHVCVFKSKKYIYTQDVQVFIDVVHVKHGFVHCRQTNEAAISSVLFGHMEWHEFVLL